MKKTKEILNPRKEEKQMTNNYPKAYSQVLEIVKYLPKDDYEKIPHSKIDFFEKYKDKEYTYDFNPQKDIQSQGIMRETYAIIILLYQEFFATQIQREKINKILEINEEEQQKIARERYNPDNIFKAHNETIKQKNEQKQEKDLMDLTTIKWYQKLILHLKKMIRKC